MLCPLVNSSRRRPNLTFGKFHIKEIATWKIVPWEVAIGKKSFELSSPPALSSQIYWSELSSPPVFFVSNILVVNSLPLRFYRLKYIGRELWSFCLFLPFWGWCYMDHGCKREGKKNLRILPIALPYFSFYVQTTGLRLQKCRWPP